MELQMTPSEGIRAMMERLNREGFQACLVGGCVRDALLGRVPNDWDLCTSALPEQVELLFDRTVPTGIRHGTVTVFYGGAQAEVTTFRRESGYSDHRRPDSVVFTDSLETDLARRDFTINAMALDAHGVLHDPFGGQADLAAGVVRCVGDPERRFREDALRMFRALRFAAQLGFAVDPAALDAIGELAPEARFVAPERIHAELDKLLLSPGPELLEQVAALGLLDGYLACREVSCTGLSALPPEHLIRWTGACTALRRAGAVSDTAAFLRALHLDARTVRVCSAAAELALNPFPDTVPGIKRLLAGYGVETVRCAAACAGQGTALVDGVLASGACYDTAHLAVTGADLTARGVTGPAVGQVLHRLLDHVIDCPADNDRGVLLKFLEEELEHD